MAKLGRAPKFVQTAPHDSSMKNPTQLSSLALLPGDVNNLGEFQEDSAN
jgi:hypothetical protein